MRKVIGLLFGLGLVGCEGKTETIYLPYLDTGAAEDTVGGSNDAANSDDTTGVVCEAECTPGAKRCNANGVVESCKDRDDDGCGEWGDPTPCASSQTCSEGQCAIGCTDECTVQNARQCDGDSVESCRDHDGNGCLEWGGKVDCVGSTVCVNGFCSVACDDGTAECTVNAAKKCEAGGVSVCADLDFDGCLTWSDPTKCPGEQACSNGGCSNTCTDECTVIGARHCDGSNATATCGQSDTDDCLEWGAPQTCETGETCSNGFCKKGCEAECSVIGAASCSGAAVQTCGDANDDGCLEWGTAVPCDGSLVCSNGYCSVTCSDECSVSGVRICDTGGVKECGDKNADGCLEWGTVVPCELGQTCSNGQCATGCTDECSVSGGRRCLGLTVQICGTTDADPCLEWGTATPCAAGEVCSNGFCSTDCTDECAAIGAAACDGDAVRTCGAAASGCLALGEPVACAPGLSCSNGKCASTCTDECTVQGAKKCVGTGVSACGNTDSDSCLEWGTAAPCGNAQTCSGGFCTAACNDECTVQGAKACEGAGVKTCDDGNLDGCLEWSTVTVCSASTTCSNGLCSSTCDDECGPSGSKRCEGSGVQVCGNTDADACLEWGTAVACGGSQTCSGGACALGCSDECTVKGARQCAAAATYQICDDKNADGCLEWGTAASCGGGQLCANGSCALTCENECTTSGIKRCNVATTGVETCAEHDGDGCLEWGAAVVCGVGQSCASGSCTLSCTNACPTSGEKRCNAGGLGIETCGDTNTDGCLEWSAPVACGNTAQCSGGACTDLPVPGVVKINEILYDDAGGDTSGFVELKGPPGLDLTGFSIVGVNGTNGTDYGAITLTGSIPSDGYLVVATPTASPDILAAADQTSALADYQNGPDSVQLRWGKTPVDAVGYGSFGGGTFAGEGQPAVDVPAGQSLGRNSAGADTGNNVADFFGYPSPTPGGPNGVANAAPVAKLSCPASGKTGTALSVDASGSTDADGTIAAYAFAWGDGYSSAGPTATASRTYLNPGSYTVTLTVTDNAGAQGTATCTLPIADALAPAVVLVAPAADVQVTQGTVVSGISVDVTPSAGRSVASVQLMIDGVAVGSPDTIAPYTFSYAIPANAVTDTALVLQAKATDNAGAVGISGARKLNVRNDKPVASLAAIITGNLQVTADASGSSDTETAAANLEVRWDWEGDGTWDTPFATTKTLNHTYATDGQHTIKIEVKDAVGQTTTASRTVNFQSVLDVSGNVTSTLWYGTINITGDVTVPTGETLSVAPGTTIVFLEFDQDTNGVGDFDITVNGTLKILGTEAEPVIITTLDTNGTQNVSSWGTIRLQGSGGHIVQNTTIEWGDTALDVRAGATLTNLEIRKSKVGLALAAAGISGTDLSIHDNTTDGVVANAATFSINGLSSVKNGRRGLLVTAGGASQLQNCVLEDNVTHGAELDGGNVGFDTCSLQRNGGTGLYYRGNAKGLATHSTIRTNGYEGVRAHWSATGNPTPVVNYNNIFENGATGSMAAVNPGLSQSGTSSSGTYTSSAYTAPSGGQLLLIEAEYSDSNYFDITGRILAGASGSTALKEFTDTTSRAYYDVSSSNQTGFRLQITDTHSSSNGTLSATTAVYTKGPSKQVTTHLLAASAGIIDIRHNYLGAWPKVLNNVSYTTAATLKLGGFVSAPFGADFDSTNHWGEVDIDGDTTWSSDVYVTGAVTLKTGGKLTIEKGVKVVFVPTDVNDDEMGDWRIDRAGGALLVNGTVDSPVAFSALIGAPADLPAKGGYVGLSASGTGSTTAHFATFVDATSAVTAGTGGATTLNDSTVDAARLDGVSVADVFVGNRITIRNGAANGLVLTGTGAKSIDGLLADKNALFGVAMSGATGATNVITNGTFTTNAAGGVEIRNSTLALKQSNLKFNGFGVHAVGSAAGSVTSSNIQSNTREGVFVGPVSGSNPTVSFTGNNIYGNTQTHAMVKAASSVSQSGTSSSGTYTSTAYAAPSGGAILYFEASYSDSNYFDITGSVLGPSTTLKSFTDTVNSAWYDVVYPGVANIRAQIVDTHSSSNGTLSIPNVVQLAPTTPLAEMAALRTTSGKIVATGNYWGLTVPTASQVVELLSATIDYTSFKTTPVASTGPQ